MASTSDNLQTVKHAFVKNITASGLQPYALAVGNDNKLFIASSGTVYQFDVTKPNATCKFGERDGIGSIRGIAVSYEFGEVFISDTDHHRILRYDLNTFNKTGEIGDETNLYYPCGLAVLKYGDSAEVWVVNRDHHKLDVFSLEGTHMRSIGQKGDIPGEVRRPECILFQPEISSEMVLADWGNNRIQLINTEKSEAQFEIVTVDNCTFDRLRSAVFVEKDILAAIDFGKNVIKFLKRDAEKWKFIGSLGSKGSKDGQFRFPVWLAWDCNSRSLFVSDSGNGRVCQFEIQNFDEV